jgi:hypothetical protein
MANSAQVRKALIELMSRLEGMRGNGNPKGPAGAKARTPIDSPEGPRNEESVDAIMGVGPQRNNAFQEEKYRSTQPESSIGPEVPTSPRLDSVGNEELKSIRRPSNEPAKGSPNTEISPEDVFTKHETGPRFKNERIDFEGDKRASEVERIQGEMAQDAIDDPLFPNPKHPRSYTSQRARESVNLESINAEVQDTMTLFKEMFDVKALGAASRQGSVASRLRDAWKKLSTNAPLARKGDEAAIKKIRDIRTWMSKQGPAKESSKPRLDKMRQLKANRLGKNSDDANVLQEFKGKK